VALDKAREAHDVNPIGTTGRGIGPAYEDKIARRAIKVSDLFDFGRFSKKLEELLNYHNFILKNYYHKPEVELAPLLEDAKKMG